MKSTELKYWRPGISTKALARLAAPALLAVLSMSASCGGDGEVVAQECEGTVCPCNEAGIRDAISKGGDRYTFACNGPTTVTTEAEIVIENDVVLDGEDNLIVEGGMTHRVFRVPLDVTVELRRLTIKRGGGVQQGGGVANSGLLTIRESTISDSVVDGDGAGIGAGGIHNRILGDLTLINSTVSGNGTVEGVGGGIGNDVGAKLTVIDSTVSGNATPDLRRGQNCKPRIGHDLGRQRLRERCQLQCRRPVERTDGRAHRGGQRRLGEHRTEWPRRRDRQLWRDGVHRDHDGFGERRRELSWWRDLQRPLGHDEVDREHGLEEQQPIPIRRYRERGHADDREQHDLETARSTTRGGLASANRRP